MGQKKSSFDRLPAGWKVQVRVRKTGKKDKYYIDPVNGYLFRSMTEVFRYLETGKVGRLGSKPKEQGPINLESRHNSLFSFAETKGERTTDSKAEEQSIGKQCLKSDTAAIDNVNLPKADKLAQREKKESASPVTHVSFKNLTTGNGLELTKCKKRKLNEKKVADLPCRISKLLTDIEVNLSLDPNIHTQVCRASGRHTSKVELNCADKGENLANSDIHVEERVSTINEADNKQKTPGDATFQDEHAKNGVAECMGVEKPEVSLDLSFTDLWKDPCIEFAIKTLTGAMPIGDENKVAMMNQGSSSWLLDALPAGSCLDLPCDEDIWSDPCFEFAVKTLTGEIDTTIDTILQQPSHNSSEIIGHNDLTLPPSGCSHGSVSFRHPNVAETAVHKQQR